MKLMTRPAVAFMTVLLALPPAAAMVSAQDEPAPWPTNGWAASTPEEQGMDSALLAEGVGYLLEQDAFDIHSLTVIRNGHIVADTYFYPCTEGSLHDLASVTKSFTSTLVAIANDAALIESLEATGLEPLARSRGGQRPPTRRP